MKGKMLYLTLEKNPSNFLFLGYINSINIYRITFYVLHYLTGARQTKINLTKYVPPLFFS